MRQVFIQFPWVHEPAPNAFYALFRRYGQPLHLKPGQSLYNGGVEGEVAWVVNGLCGFQMRDSKLNPHYFTLVPAGRLVGNVDAYTGSVVNILDVALRPTDVLLLSRHTFLQMLHQDVALNDAHTEMLVHEHESDMEGLFSAMTDTIAVRLARLLAALLFQNEKRLTFNWDKALERFTPTPIPYQLTVTELAQTIGATRTMTSLTLTQWEKSGLLIRKGQTRYVTRALLAQATDWLTSEDRPKASV